MTQSEIILDMLKRGPITPLDAQREAGCMRLAARIYDLRRRGHHIIEEAYKTPSGKTVGRYHLKETAAC